MSVHDFADDNTVCSFAKILRGLVTILQSECETAINWLHNNKMIVNPDKFQVIILDKGRSDKRKHGSRDKKRKNKIDFISDTSPQNSC